MKRLIFVILYLAAALFVCIYMYQYRISNKADRQIKMLNDATIALNHATTNAEVDSIQVVVIRNIKHYKTDEFTKAYDDYQMALTSASIRTNIKIPSVDDYIESIIFPDSMKVN